MFSFIYTGSNLQYHDCKVVWVLGCFSYAALSLNYRIHRNNSQSNMAITTITIGNGFYFPRQIYKIDSSFLPWASADFFPGEGKIFQGGGQKHTICPKNTKKDTIFVLKSQKTYYFGQPGGVKGPLLPSPADAHEYSQY